MRWISAAALALSGCATPKTIVEVPPCTDRVEVVGQAVRLSPQRFELDHTFDFVGTKTELRFERRGAPPYKVEFLNNQPDPARLLLSTAISVVGGLLIASAIYDTRVLGLDLLDERPFYETVWGTGMVAVGALGMTTGWHPDRRVIRLDEACDGHEERDGTFER